MGEGLAFYKSSILSAVYQRESRVKRAHKSLIFNKIQQRLQKSRIFFMLKKVIKNSEVSVIGPLFFSENFVAAFSPDSKSELNCAIFDTHFEFM